MFRVCCGGEGHCDRVALILEGRGLEVRDVVPLEGLWGRLLRALLRRGRGPPRGAAIHDHEFELAMGSYGDAYTLLYDLREECSGRIGGIRLRTAGRGWE